MKLNLKYINRNTFHIQRDPAHLNDSKTEVNLLGHVSKRMALWLKKFLKRQTNSGTKSDYQKNACQRGGGYGLEIPCDYPFYTAIHFHVSSS